MNPPPDISNPVNRFDERGFEEIVDDATLDATSRDETNPIHAQGSSHHLGSLGHHNHPITNHQTNHHHPSYHGSHGDELVDDDDEDDEHVDHEIVDVDSSHSNSPTTSPSPTTHLIHHHHPSSHPASNSVSSLPSRRDGSKKPNFDFENNSSFLGPPESFWDKLKRCGNDPNATPLPWAQLSVVMLVTLSEGVNTSILLPFVSFMVIELFGYPESEVGYYAGWLTSIYFLAQIGSSIVLGQLSDIKGRRPIILIGVVGNFITTIVFGLSRKFWLALVARFLCGLLNGNVGVLKSYIREITDETNQARAYTLRSAGYAIGTILGPLIGGALARPSKQYPNLFDQNGFFATFPFLLPCLASAIISLTSAILGFFTLQETVKFELLDEKKTREEEEQQRGHHSKHGHQHDTNDDTNDDSNDDHQQVMMDDMLDLKASSIDIPSRSDFSVFLSLLFDRLGKFKDALKERDVVISILLYAGVSFNMLGYDEVFAFWAIRSHEQGGVGFSTLSIGVAHAISAVGMLFMQLFAYVPMDRYFGTQNTLTIATGLIIPAFIFIPFTNSLYHFKVIMWIILSILMIMKAGFGTIGFAAVNLLVNNAAGGQTIGAVNGLSASAASLARVLAPVTLGSLYAATSNSKLGFPFDYHFVFLLMALISAIIMIGSHYALPPSINKRKL